MKAVCGEHGPEKSKERLWLKPVALEWDGTNNYVPLDQVDYRPSEGRTKLSDEYGERITLNQARELSAKSLFSTFKVEDTEPDEPTIIEEPT